MIFRLPRKEWKPKTNETLFPQNCLVCMIPIAKEKSSQVGEIVYNPQVTPTEELKNFRVPIPLCQTHYEKYQQGVVLAKRSMHFLLGGIIPFTLSLVMMSIFEPNIYLIFLFAISLALSIMGYALMGPANKFLGENGRNCFEIRHVSGSEIIIDVQDKVLAEFLSTKYRGE